MTIHLYVDGGVLGGKNPGVAVYWSVGQEMPDGTTKLLTERAESWEHTTNNEAEYLALLDALEHAADAGAARVRIHSDSQLIVNQFNGKWRCGKPELAELLRTCRKNAAFLAEGGIEVQLVWVRRKENVTRLGH